MIGMGLLMTGLWLGACQSIRCDGVNTIKQPQTPHYKEVVTMIISDAYKKGSVSKISRGGDYFMFFDEFDFIPVFRRNEMDAEGLPKYYDQEEFDKYFEGEWWYREYFEERFEFLDKYYDEEYFEEMFMDLEHYYYNGYLEEYSEEFNYDMYTIKGCFENFGKSKFKVVLSDIEVFDGIGGGDNVKSLSEIVEIIDNAMMDVISVIEQGVEMYSSWDEFETKRMIIEGFGDYGFEINIEFDTNNGLVQYTFDYDPNLNLQ